VPGCVTGKQKYCSRTEHEWFPPFHSASIGNCPAWPSKRYRSVYHPPSGHASSINIMVARYAYKLCQATLLAIPPDCHAYYVHSIDERHSRQDQRLYSTSTACLFATSKASKVDLNSQLYGSYSNWLHIKKEQATLRSEVTAWISLERYTTSGLTSSTYNVALTMTD
jgi:hypothetical protein